MQSGLKSVLGGLLLVVCFLLSAWPAAAQNAPQDHSQIYKRAVGALDGAEKKLAGNYTAEAKNLLKESRSLFGILQKEMPDKMKTMELTQAQDDQYSSNQKLGDDSSAQGQRLEQTAQEKQKKSESLEAQGNQDMAVKLQQEAVQEMNLAQKAYLKAEIYHLKNLQLAFSFLK
jgi:Skp family chaperone for outer membrane proteins